MAKLFLRPKVDGSWRVAITDHLKASFRGPMEWVTLLGQR
jgi:hypothetical protein